MFDVPSTLSERRDHFSRRRVFAFVCSFMLASAIGLTYVYIRPPEYRAIARLQIIPAGVVTEASDKQSPALKDAPEAFLTEVQVLTSRPLLEVAVNQLRNDRRLPSLGQDPIGAVQQMLRAEPIEGTQVVQLTAEGPQQSLVSELVNAVALAYRQQVLEGFKNRATTTYEDVRAEAKLLREEVLAKQSALESYRARYEIVSLERNENGILAKIEGLNRSYAESNDQLAKAQGRLQALRGSVAAGKLIVSAKNNPTLANIEQRTSELREQLQDLRRRYTPEYLALDADATALQARIANLEQQLKLEQAASQQAMLTEAEDEFSSTQAAVNRLRLDLAENQKAAREFASRLGAFKVMQTDLDRVQDIERAVADRLTRLQSSERERAPRVAILEAAAPSLKPWRPDYTRDALISLASALAFGVLTTWLVDFVGGRPPGRSISISHSLTPSVGRSPTSPPRSVGLQGAVQLLAPNARPRTELGYNEPVAFLPNGTDDLRLISVALLIGMKAEEIVALRWDDVDWTRGAITVGGETPRTLSLNEPLLSLLKLRRMGMREEGTTILHNDRGDPLTVEDLERTILTRKGN